MTRKMKSQRRKEHDQEQEELKKKAEKEQKHDQEEEAEKKAGRGTRRAVEDTEKPEEAEEQEGGGSQAPLLGTRTPQKLSCVTKMRLRPAKRSPTHKEMSPGSASPASEGSGRKAQYSLISALTSEQLPNLGTGPGGF